MVLFATNRGVYNDDKTLVNPASGDTHMRSTMKFAAASAIAVLAAGLSAAPASAACTKLGFSVNDYGKDGPTKDAKELLDKYIAKTMAERGITDYKTGPKSVTCELFLNFIVFDEHTCKAEANVCWGGSTPGPAGAEAAATATAPATKTASKPKSAPKEATAPAPEAKPAPKDETAAAPAESGDAAKPASN
jgi:cell division septation protein DedD